MRWRREPVLWFCLIGALLFTANYLQQTERIVIDDVVRDRISALWQTQMNQPPTEPELQSLVDAWLRQEVLYREAVRQGLMEDDDIVRRRLIQKLGFLHQLPEDIPVSQAELDIYYQANIQRYTLPQRYSFKHIYLLDPLSKASVNARLMAGEDWQTLGSATLLPRTYLSKTEREVTVLLGGEFASQLAALVQANWTGPYKSSYGHHLVYLEKRIAPEATPLTYIRTKVHADLIRQKSEEAVDALYRQLLEHYEVVYH
jgi:hypothetical protein